MEIVFRELALFAACGFLLIALDNLTIDLLWLRRTLRRTLRRFRGKPNNSRRMPAQLADNAVPGRHAVFIPAWDEANVIGPMLEHMARQFEGRNYRAFVGCYPNDPATIAEVKEVAERYPKICLVICRKQGPTTKADCLNALWKAMEAEEDRSRTKFRSVILHDAEDVVDPHEISLFDRMIGSHDLIQIPVIPLPDPNSAWIAGHYCDEFAEAHGKDLPMRSALGAAVPSAGVGCAIARSVLGDLAKQRGDVPFDKDSLTEDYELGLTLAQQGCKGSFVRCHAGEDNDLIAVRAHFPATLGAALRQKTRWVAGISLFGWDRLGWDVGFADFWMRLRDRCTILAALVLTAGYAAALLGLGLVIIASIFPVSFTPLPDYLAVLLSINFALLLWRLAMRAIFTARVYGWRSAITALPRIVVSNVISIMVARRALTQYLLTRRGGRPAWEKTKHVFPAAKLR
ncbi:glycosyl transferase family protein [Parasphingopyxis sp. CP4]|uniref:glycosyl transferase family protein n=1 Tax=Parasphingopyxis sp. CP4 TaxID=2724527 RepID=UPI0015A00701|nr:glycosyl transferase family protein [Parasphingopyxis sp. CP4]QLC22831.1 glycosyl transferase family protein [Parasphingopyxis sp. CP4]